MFSGVIGKKWLNFSIFVQWHHISKFQSDVPPPQHNSACPATGPPPPPPPDIHHHHDHHHGCSTTSHWISSHFIPSPCYIFTPQFPTQQNQVVFVSTHHLHRSRHPTHRHRSIPCRHHPLQKSSQLVVWMCGHGVWHGCCWWFNTFDQVWLVDDRLESHGTFTTHERRGLGD